MERMEKMEKIFQIGIVDDRYKLLVIITKWIWYNAAFFFTKIARMH